MKFTSVLILFGLLQIRNAFLSPSEEHERAAPSHRHLFLIGVIFTGLNPYFILWWLTVGAQLILISLEFAALAGVVFMYLCHVWMDYAWLIGVAHFAKKDSLRELPLNHAFTQIMKDRNKPLDLCE